MLKTLRFKMEKGRIHIEDYPDAVALKRIDDPVARQLQAMTLHHADLEFCQAALAEVSRLDRTQQPLVVEALWIASIARFFKCFGRNEARTQLSAKKIFRGSPGAEAVFAYFDALRNKHIVHDENPYSQAFTGIALNAQGAEYKVADIIAIGMNAFTVDDAHLVQLKQLVDATFQWVAAKREELHNRLGTAYEEKPYRELSALPDITYTVPTNTQVDRRR